MKINSSTSFLLIGSGRLAKHLQFYFRQKKISFTTWNRSQDLDLLPKLVSSSSHVLLAISDSALQSFVDTHLKNSTIPAVHFSGALNISGMASAHPLMSFGPELYPIQDYEKIHFTISGAATLPDLLPGLQNSYSEILPWQKPLYHALCVLGGNFPVILWNKMAEGFQELGLPPESSKIYLEKIVQNFNHYGAQALTGPLVRNDKVTIQSNIKALSGDAFQKIYSAFVEAYK